MVIKIVKVGIWCSYKYKKREIHHFRILNQHSATAPQSSDSQAPGNTFYCPASPSMRYVNQDGHTNSTNRFTSQWRNGMGGTGHGPSL